VELTLNLAWAALAAVMVWLWLRHASSSGCSRGAQLVALAVLVMILFPVISVSDDLQALQNPAEADCCVRRDHVVAGTHFVLPPPVAFFAPRVSQPPLGILRVAAPGDLPAPVEDHPSLAAIDNRPPPVA
jgi:hypothetical protein